MSTNKRKKDNSIDNRIATDYGIIMNGFCTSPLFHNEPQLSHGKYVQLSAYEEKRFGEAVTTRNNSIAITK